jgi:hypothetical protein
MKQIVVTISPNGQTTVAAEGFEGSQCRDATARLREILGLSIKEQLTPGYYQSRTTAQQEENRA